jgi:aminoglycoside phosphotransferase (APT) family kinase protein
VTGAGAVDGVDLARLTAWMDAQELGSGPIHDVTALGGGTQNILLRFTRAGRSYVLRRPPLHKRANSDETMRREARVLAALAGTDVPHPGLIAACPDEDVLGAAFYLMEPVDGVNPTLGLPPTWGGDQSQRHAFGLSMADALAAVGAVDHVAVGLGDLGRAEGFLERQVARWGAHLASYSQLPGYGPVPRIGGTGEVGRWLDVHRPAAWTPGLLHGDYHLANVLADPLSPRVAAVVDWELTTIGDPLLDLGWLLSSWPAGRGPSLWSGDADVADGLPTTGELLDRYADRTTRDLTAMRWYEVLACYKIGIVLEGTHARALAGQAPVETGDLLHRHATFLLERAQERIATP